VVWSWEAVDRQRNRSIDLRSIKEGVSVGEVVDILTLEEKARLQTYAGTVRLWGTTLARRNIWERMREGDHVLFVPSGSGVYSFYGKVLFTSHNVALAQRMEDLEVWPEEGRRYEFVFFVDNFREIAIPKKKGQCDSSLGSGNPSPVYESRK
jgi:hypothetical protein